MNSIEPSTFASLQMMNLDGQLPAIVNTKANITERAKSESRFRKVKEPMTRKSTVSQNKN